MDTRLKNYAEEFYKLWECHRNEIRDTYIAKAEALDKAMAEITKLRKDLDTAIKERDFLVHEYERGVKCGSLGFAHAAMHIYNAIVNAKCDVNADRFIELADEIDRLRRDREATIRKSKESIIRKAWMTACGWTTEADGNCSIKRQDLEAYIKQELGKS